jgi:PRTRC genetic system protein B
MRVTEEAIDYTALGLARAGIAPAVYPDGLTYWYGDEDDRSLYQELLMRVDLFSESVVLTKYDGRQAVQCYEVAPSDLASAFSGLPLATGLLPRDTLFYAMAEGRPRIGIYLAPQRRTLPLTERALAEVGADTGVSALEIPLPPLVFVGHGNAYRVAAVKEYPKSGNTHLYYAPLPNAHADGRICAGTAELPVCAPETIWQAVETFFTSKFNTHLIDGKSKAHHSNVLAMWKEVAKSGAEVYPLDDLQPMAQRLEDLWS